MRFFARIAAPLALLLALAFPAFARELSDAERQGLAERVESFEAAILASDMVTVFEAMPSQVFEKAAAKAGFTTEDLIASSQQLAAEAFKNMTFVSFTMDLDSAEFVALAHGDTYALIPTETVIEIIQDEAVAGKFRASAWTLGLLDDGTWYLMSIDDPAQVAAIREIYPALADVEFPAATGGPMTE